MTFLSIENLKVQYQTQGKIIHAVTDVTFSLEDNETIGIAGESGCGKSTLGMAIIRANQGGKIVSGDIFVEGKSINEMSEDYFAKNLRWKEISMIFQGAMNSLDPVFTVKQQLSEILDTYHFAGDYQKTISEALNSVGLSLEILQKSPHELSGGMKQRLVIAMALILKPKFVIADEPTTALDVLIQAQIVSLLKKLKKDGMSIMIISHDLGLISEIADKVGIMYAGEIVEFGKLEEVYSNPKHPYTQALLKSVPKMIGNENLISLKGEPPTLSDIPKGCSFYERCPMAMDKCKRDPPKIKTETGYTLCWLYD